VTRPRPFLETNNQGLSGPYPGIYCYEIQYTWTARSTETETETGLDRYVMLAARWLTEY